jgi:predicted peptidase
MRPIFSFICVLAASLPVSAKVFDKATQAAGVTVYYKVALPQNYDSQKTYPGVLAFPPGSQTKDMVLTTMMQNWQSEAARRGYIVVVPEAPNGRLFVAEGAKIFPEFLEHLLKEYKIRGGKFHVAGMSNGGRSAFHIAASHPQYFTSIIGFPGYLPDATPARIAAIAGMCIYMHVGELDGGWLKQMQDQAAMLRSQKLSVRFMIEKGEGHVMRTLAFDRSGRLFDEMEESARGCGAK